MNVFCLIPSRFDWLGVSFVRLFKLARALLRLPERSSPASEHFRGLPERFSLEAEHLFDLPERFSLEAEHLFDLPERFSPAPERCFGLPERIFSDLSITST